jgi:hypothetical protein
MVSTLESDLNLDGNFSAAPRGKKKLWIETHLSKRDREVKAGEPSIFGLV